MEQLWAEERDPRANSIGGDFSVFQGEGSLHTAPLLFPKKLFYFCTWKDN